MRNYTPRRLQSYKDTIVYSLKEEYGYSSIMGVPKLQKIVISQGLGDAVADKKNH